MTVLYDHCMIHAGLDLGKNKVALSLYKGHELTFVGHYEVPSTTPRPLALQMLAVWTYGYTKTADHIWIEEPLVGRSPRASLFLAQTCGAIMATYGQLPGRSVTLVPVATWKKDVVGRGNADKKAVAAWLELNQPDASAKCEGNQDRIDATCIGLFGARNTELAQRILGNLG